MFNEKRSLVIVYKDELLLNQMRKLIETNDDTEDSIVGVRDGSIKIISWDEKMWLGQKKSGMLQNKVLFLGDIKGTDKLIPILDIKFEKYGVMYGWAGNQAVLTCDMKKLGKEEYQEFLREISSMDIPESIKTANKINAEETTEDIDTEVTEQLSAENEAHKGILLKNIKKVAEISVDKISDAIDIAAKNTEELRNNIIRDKTAMKRQMLFYGIFNLYNNDLESFLNS